MAIDSTAYKPRGGKLAVGAHRATLMVLGGEHRNALGIVRNLGGLGIPLFVGGDSRLARSLYSRYADRRFVYPPVGRDLEAAHSRVIEKVREWRPDVLLPTMDAGWTLVRAFYDDYAKFTTVVPHPANQLFEQVINKATMTQLAQSLGVETPCSYFPEPGDSAAAQHHALSYPVLLKPLQGEGGKGIRIARDAAELSAATGAIKVPFMIQEFINGEDLELTILCVRGEPVAGSACMSLRNAPLPYGPPVACRTIKDDPLMEAGIRLLRGLKYHGVAHLDFRRDQRDGKPKLLDFNARLAGTNEISVLSGVNFPLLLYRLALGEDVETGFDYPSDLEFRWIIFGEARHLIQTRDKLGVLKEFLLRKGVSTNVWPTDPLPHLAHLLGTVWRA